jgi:hypothetical protein
MRLQLEIAARRNAISWNDPDASQLQNGSVAGHDVPSDRLRRALMRHTVRTGPFTGALGMQRRCSSPPKRMILSEGAQRVLHPEHAPASECGSSSTVSRPRTIMVWDLPTRIFKWSLVLAVTIAFLFSSSHPRGLLFIILVACGHTVTLLLLFRLAWGFIGGRCAGFRSFTYGWSGSGLTPRACCDLIPCERLGIAQSEAG